jgi:hypothetical protein
MPTKNINPTSAVPTGSRKTKTVMIVAGEASGDMHGAALVYEMSKINPSLNFYGIGGSQLEKMGVKLFVNNSSLAVMGITEVVSKLISIVKILAMMKKSFHGTDCPDAHHTAAYWPGQHHCRQNDCPGIASAGG